MATSGSFDFISTVTRNDIIDFALKKAGIKRKGFALDADQISDAAFALNLILAQMKENSDGAASLKLWLRKRIRIFLQDGKDQYDTSDSTDHIVAEDDLSKALFLFHTPPYKTNLDRAALDGKMIEHVPLDVHVGSIAVQRFLESNKPLVSLHGHVHESARITGSWKDKIGSTYLFSAAHDGPELALVRFDLDTPKVHSRELI